MHNRILPALLKLSLFSAKKAANPQTTRNWRSSSALSNHADSRVTPLGISERTVRAYLNGIRRTRGQAVEGRGGPCIRDRLDRPCRGRGAAGADLSDTELVVLRSPYPLDRCEQLAGNALRNAGESRWSQRLRRRASGRSRCKPTGQEDVHVTLTVELHVQ